MPGKEELELSRIMEKSEPAGELRRSEVYLVMSLLTCQCTPGYIGRGVVVRRISAPSSQIEAIRSC